MGLGGISGKRFEQEVIDVVREAARVLYINRSGNEAHSPVTKRKVSEAPIRTTLCPQRRRRRRLRVQCSQRCSSRSATATTTPNALRSVASSVVLNISAVCAKTDLKSLVASLVRHHARMRTLCFLPVSVSIAHATRDRGHETNIKGDGAIEWLVDAFDSRTCHNRAAQRAIFDNASHLLGPGIFF